MPAVNAILRSTFNISDNCFSDGPKLKKIYGPQISVKLDLFRAVSREIKKKSLPRKRRAMFNHELSSAFRAIGDTGKERKLPTPDRTTITKNLQNIRANWKNEIPCTVVF